MSTVSGDAADEAARDRQELVRRALRELKAARAEIAELKSRSRARREPVAVVGVGCRFPGTGPSGGVPAFWNLLRTGGSGVGVIPADRWQAGDWYSPEVGAPGRVYARHGGFVEDVHGFDAGLFGVPPREAHSMDPQQRLVLEVAWEALESAGTAPDGLRGTRTGVFVGVGGSDHVRLGAATGDPSLIDAYAATGGSVNFVANRLSYALGLEGPSLAVDTACSSSLVALHLAVQGLRAGECDAALAGGVNVLLSPDAWVALCQGRMLSVEGLCRTFDADADGYVRGEGCGVVVLKRLPDAERDGDDILAVVRGTAVNQDGRSSGITVPNGAAQQDVIRQALAAAEVSPAEVGYVEAHGTGTPLGDPIEIRALARVLGEDRPPDRPLMVGSVKTNIGHLEAAAGIAGFIKAVLAVRHGIVPAHRNVRALNPHVRWDELAVTVPVEPTGWHGERRIAGVSSFGFGGTNAHVVLEGPPAEAPQPPLPPDTPVVVKISGSGDAAVREGAARLAGFLDGRPELTPADVAWSMGAGRGDLAERAAVVAQTPSELIDGLRAVAAGGAEVKGRARGRRPAEGPPRVVFGVPGEPPGAALVTDMLEELTRRAPALAPVLDALTGAVGPVADQPDPVAAYCLTVVLGTWWRSVGVEPDRVEGHGWGAYAAAALAGALPAEDGARLVRAVATGAVNGRAADLIGAAGRAEPRAELVIDGDGPGGGEPVESEVRVVLDLGTGPEDTKNPHRALLESLAGIWARGADVTWTAVNPRRRRPDDLPAYPFQHRPYRMPEGRAAPAPAPAPGAALRPEIVLPATGGAIAETVLSLSRVPFLDEHRVHGRIVVPGVVLLELVLRAGERLLGPTPLIEDLTISRPMVLADDAERRVRVVVDPAEAGRARARVFGADGSGAWHVQLEAWVTAGTAPVPANGERGSSATGGPYTEDLASEDFYQRAWHPSFALGPSFRLVRSARRGPHVAEGTIAVPDGTVAGILAGVRPDLLLLDACVQLVPVAEGPVSADGAVHLGTGYERIVVREPISSGGHRCAAFTRTAADGTLTGDLFVTDGEGRRVAEMYGVSFRAVSVSMLERLVASTERGAPSVPSGPDLAGLRAADERERARLVLGHLRRLVAAVLGTEPEEIDPGASLTDHLDSLMMAELKDAVERDFEVPLPLERLFEDGRIAALAGLVAAAIKPPLDTPPARSPGASRVPSARLEPLTVAEMTRRAALDGEITAGGDPEPPGTAPGGVLLTGATGFVGAFLLAELLDRMPGPVHCLVRAGDEAHALRRIMENLDDHGVDIGEHRSRVVPVVGDLTEPLLGLSRRDFEGLHAAVGEIVHCGAVVKWTYPYRGLAPANVDGTREVLRLATVGAPRPVHFASTVGVFSSRDYTADLVPETEDLAASGPLAVGYAQTKWVAERMVRTAAERGLPVTIHRINTGGHSVTGAFNRLDHLSMMVKGCVEAGIAPEHAEMPVQPAPVDYVARAMAEACARPDLRGHTFHLVNGRAMSWPEFFDAIEGFGYRLERLPFEEWRARITGRRSGTMALLGLIPFLTEAVDQVRLPASDSARTRAVLEARGVTCPPLETGLVHTYLDAFVRNGFIDPPGRNS